MYIPCIKNIQSVGQISAILLTIVGDVRPIYNKYSKVDSFLRKGCFLFSPHTAYNVRDNAKTFASVR